MKKITTLTFVVMADDFPDLDTDGGEDWVNEVEAAIRNAVPSAEIMNQSVSGVEEDGSFSEYTDELSADPKERAAQQAEIFLANHG
jgi:hypothetical protein